MDDEDAVAAKLVSRWMDALSMAESMKSNTLYLSVEPCWLDAALGGAALSCERGENPAFEVKPHALTQTKKRHTNSAPESEREKDNFFIMRPLFSSMADCRSCQFILSHAGAAAAAQAGDSKTIYLYNIPFSS